MYLLRSASVARASCRKEELFQKRPNPGRGIFAFLTRNNTPPTAEPRSKRPKTPLPNAEAVIGSLDEFLALPRDGKWAENSSLARRTRVIQNPIADFGQETTLAARDEFDYRR